MFLLVTLFQNFQCLLEVMKCGNVSSLVRIGPDMLKWCQFNKQAIDAVCHLPSQTQMWQGVKFARSEFQIWAKLLLESCEFTLFTADWD
jgi:hypothetical protein